MQRFCIILICLFTIGGLHSQNPYFHFNKISASELKLHSGVVQAYQDHLGYIWFCGFDGVTRYNGHKFETIFDLYPETKHIAIKAFRDIHIESEYTIWLSSIGSGLIRISNDGTVTNFDNLTKADQKLPSKSVFKSIPIDNQVWIMGDFGIMAYEWKNESYEVLPIDLIPNSDIIVDIKTFDQKHIWLNDNKAIYKYNTIDKEIEEFEGFSRSEIFEDIDGNLWIIKRENGNYLYKYDSETNSFKKSDKQPFSTIKETLTLTWDHQNRVWASAFNTQIYMADMDSGELVIKENGQHNLDFSQFSRKPLVDKSGAVWIVNASAYMLPYSSGFSPIHFEATKSKLINGFHLDEDYAILCVQGEGLVFINRRTKEERVFTKENSNLAHVHVSRIKKIGNGKYIVGLVNFCQFFDVEKGIVRTIRTKGIVRSIFEDDDYYWIGGLIDLMRISKLDYSTKHFKFETLEGNMRNSIHQIAVKDENHLWVFGARNGVQTLNKNTGKISAVPGLTNLKGNPSIFSKLVDADVSDDGDKIAIGTESGLFVYNLKNETLGSFESVQEYINTTLFQSDSILWASTKNDLVRCNCNTLKCKKYGQKDGLVNSIFRIRSKLKSDEGQLFFGGNRGIDVVPIDNQIQTNPFPPLLQVRALVVNRNERITIDHNGKTDIAPNANLTEVWVDAMHASHGDELIVEYKYKEESNWNPLKFGDLLTLVNPRPGIHEIEFRAFNADGIQSAENVRIKLDFLEIWYESSWFKWFLGSFIMGGILISIVVYNRNRRKQLERRHEMTEEINQLKLHALNAQMNPHFVFNAMSSIQQMIGARDNKLAMDYLSKFSRLLRHAIHYSSESTVSLNDEVQFIENYLQLEQARFDNLFDYSIEIDGTLTEDSIEIPSFFIQPQIENAIKHGIRNSDRKGKISIIFALNEGEINIQIEDNGIGRAQSKKINSMSNDYTNRGIALTRKRINQLNSQGISSSFKIIDLENEDGKALGTRVILTFKLMKLQDQ